MSTTGEHPPPAEGSPSAGEPPDPSDAESIGPDPNEHVADGDPEVLEHTVVDELFVDGTRQPTIIEAERDEYRDTLQRVKAEFENYKKRVARERQDTIDRAAEQLVVELLPVLDACEAAVAQGHVDVEPVQKHLSEILVKAGLERMDPVGEPFDPNSHDAVLSEEGDGGEPVVAESLRTGYSWKGRVVRPAMVKVRA